MIRADAVANKFASLLIAEKVAKDSTKALVIKAEEMERVTELARLEVLEAKQKEAQAKAAVIAIGIQHEKATSEQLDFWFSDKNLDKKKGAYEIYRDSFGKVPILLILHWPNLIKLCENINICYVEYIANCVTKYSSDLKMVLNAAGQTCIERIIPYATVPAKCKCLKCIQLVPGGGHNTGDESD